MKKILLLLISLFVLALSVTAQSEHYCHTMFYDTKTKEKAFIIDKDTNCLFCYYSPSDTAKIYAPLNYYHYSLKHNDSIVMAFFVGCGTECYHYFLYVKPTHKHYYLEDVLAIDWKNHILAFIPTMCNTIYFFDYLNNDTVKAYTIKNKKFYYFPYYIDTAFFWNNAFYVRWDEFVTDPNVGLPQFKPGQYSKIATFDQYNSTH